MKIPDTNHHANRTQNAVPVQRWQRIANFFKRTCRVYRRRRTLAPVRKYLMPAVPQASSLLRETIERELPHLRSLSDEAASQNDGRPGSWTRKQELGHLLDSATNNHMRIALATLNGEFRGEGYAQEKWVEAHGYRDLSWQLLVDLWHRYNELLSELMARVPEPHLNNRCLIGSSVVTLRFVMEDYVLHMQHHIDHILSRETISTYPGAAAGV